MIGNIFHDFRRREIRISSHIRKLHHDVLNMISIRANKLAPKAIEGLAKLRCAGSRLDYVGARTEAAINATLSSPG